MAIEITCPGCGQVMRASEKFAGRRAQCVACKGTVQIPRSSTGGATPSFPPLKEALEKFRVLPWEAGYARIVVRLGASEPQVVKALVALSRAGSQRSVSLCDVLVKRGIVDEDTNRRAIMTVNRQETIGGAEAATARYKECPNCFELISVSAGSCRYCGEHLAKLELMDQCPNCKSEQTPGKEFCASCGANMATGLVGDAVRRRCARCGVMSSGMEAVCAACGIPLDRTKATVHARNAASRLLDFVDAWKGMIILAVLVMIGLWAYKHRAELLGRAAREIHGAAEAGLRSRLDAWVDAVTYGDLETMAGMVDPGMTPEEVKASMGAIAGLEQEGETIESLEQSAPRVNGAAATVYVDVTIKRAKKQESRSAPEDFVDAIGAIKGATPRTRVERIAWKWRQVGGEWFYVGPFGDGS